MKKILLYVTASVISASTACFADTAGIEAACRQSDKLLWDARNEKCIPRNPCAEEYEGKYGRYCNRTFKDFQSMWRTDDYIKLINIYASTHGLDCEAVPQDAKLFGQDYVVCEGTDVMVFEFDDIQNGNALTFINDIKYEKDLLKALCVASNGTMDNEITCRLMPKSACVSLEDTGITKNTGMIFDSLYNGCYLRFSNNTLQEWQQRDTDALINYNSR